MTASLYVGCADAGRGVIAARGRPVQQTHGVLPVIAGDPAALIQDLVLLRACRLARADMDRFEVLPLCVRSHDVTLLRASIDPAKSNIANGATIFAR